jgi:UDP-2,3-diacylglucosamine hydrolase
MTPDISRASASANVSVLGILAGGGGLPEQIAESAQRAGRQVHIVAIEGEAEATIARFPHLWVNWGAIGRMTASLRAAGAHDLIIVGSVTRPDLRKVRPDLGLIKAIPTIVKLFGGGDDHVLRNVVRFFEAQGFAVRGVADVAPELLAGPGALGRIAPAPVYKSDAARGFALIEALGAADVGQAVVMRDGRALAIEAAEGTDRMLARLAEGGDRRASGAILVKGAKPGQELRVDMPVIGPRTIEHAARIGLAGIAVEAGCVLIAERAAVVAQADASGLFVAGIAPPAGKRHHLPALTMSSLTRLTPDKYLRRDMARAAGVIAAVGNFATCGGVVVVRRHVIAIETGECLRAMFARVTTLRQWGATARSKRRGALALSAAGIEASGFEAVMAAAAEAGLAGVILPAGIAAATVDRAARIAEERGLAIVEIKDGWDRGQQ